MNCTASYRPAYRPCPRGLDTALDPCGCVISLRQPVPVTAALEAAVVLAVLVVTVDWVVTVVVSALEVCLRRM